MNRSEHTANELLAATIRQTTQATTARRVTLDSRRREAGTRAFQWFGVLIAAGLIATPLLLDGIRAALK